MTKLYLFSDNAELNFVCKDIYKNEIEIKSSTDINAEDLVIKSNENPTSLVIGTVDKDIDSKLSLSIFKNGEYLGLAIKSVVDCDKEEFVKDTIDDLLKKYGSGNG